MRCLLDTHTAIWYFEGNIKLTPNMRDLIESPSVEKCVSVASAWEIAIKISLGKLQFKGGSVRFFAKIAAHGFSILPIGENNLNIVETLPFHHNDPFDRMIIATAIAEDMAVITSDDIFRKYAVKLVL